MPKRKLTMKKIEEKSTNETYNDKIGEKQAKSNVSKSSELLQSNPSSSIRECTNYTLKTFLNDIERDRLTCGNSIVDFKFNKKRVKVVSKIDTINCDRNGVLYWMLRDQRVYDNWALLYAQKLALKASKSLTVCFSLYASPEITYTARYFDFLVKGLQHIQKTCQSFDISFKLLIGSPSDTIPTYVKENNLSAVVCDFSPLRQHLKWLNDIAEKLDEDVPFCQVDSHNIVPCWVTSNKLEYAARTIRTKIWKHMNMFFTQFPPVIKHPFQSDKQNYENINWNEIYSTFKVDTSIKPVHWAKPGYDEGMKVLFEFLTNGLDKYATKRNDPNIQACSQLSPWFNFGHISIQRAMLQSEKNKKKHKEGVEAFQEEGIVRRELSDNFCFYQKDYDNLNGINDWAKKTLKDHEEDKRQYIYTKQQLETADTHDELWNAAQKQLVFEGKMHGFLRMYWAKKILEWTPNPKTALEISIYLNDKYSLDGCDPNGYVGCMWSIGGIHDRAWKERDVFGKIRFMNFNGCKHKFDINQFVKIYDKFNFEK